MSLLEVALKAICSSPTLSYYTILTDLWFCAKEQQIHNPLFIYSLVILYVILQVTTADVIKKMKLT